MTWKYKFSLYTCTKQCELFIWKSFVQSKKRLNKYFYHIHAHTTSVHNTFSVCTCVLFACRVCMDILDSLFDWSNAHVIVYTHSNGVRLYGTLNLNCWIMHCALSTRVLFFIKIIMYVYTHTLLSYTTTSTCTPAFMMS